MNNLNNPPPWNIDPERPGAADGGKWNRALLASGVLFGTIPAFYWLWRQIKEKQGKDEQNVAVLTKKLKIKNFHLEQELQKTRQQAQSYKEALVIQTQQHKEECKQLQKECEELKQEKKRMGTALQRAEKEGEQFQQRAQVLLQELKPKLMRRQEIFHSHPVPFCGHRQDLEQNLLDQVAKDPLMEAELGLKEGLMDIFHYDYPCVNTNKLMQLYLRYWQQQVSLQKHKKVDEVLKGFLPNFK
ncbi:coiled-coil domain-containing protein 127-like [Colossoma macropomum]|uniref:coiled-coil domain-containing protein 127-like n=1 Tax=Colossoma macropomum TaxID=42526 RepID=UPI00186474AC|nr:coiled-coil domain-containing protein 127-like [Colossoma macropomum]